MDKLFAIGFAIAMTIQLLGKQYVGFTMGFLAITSLFLFIKEFFVRPNMLSNLQISSEFIAILFLFSCWCISSVFALNPADSWPETLEFIGMGLGGLCIYNAIDRYGFHWEIFLKILVLIVGILSSIAIMRIYIPFGDQQWGSSSYSSVLAIIYPLVFYTAFTHIKTRLAQFSILFLIVAAIFALDGRTGYIVFIILSLASLCFISSHNSFDKMKAIGLSMMANIAGVIVGLYASKIKIGEVAFNDRVTSIDLERPASGRLDIWQGSFQQFFDHPWIGIGVDGYRELNIMQDVEKHVLHPHNIILELLVDTGIIGLVAFIIVIGVVTFKYLAAYVRYHGNLKSLYAYVFLMFVGYGMASMALTSIFRSWWYLYLIMILILLAISTKQMKKFVNINEQ